MKTRLIVTLIFLGALLLTIIGGPANGKSPDNEGGYAPDRLLIKFRPGTTDSFRNSIHRAYGGRVKESIPGIDVQVVEVPGNRFLEKLKAYRGAANIEFVEPDYMVTLDPPFEPATLEAPNDYFFYDQWALDNTGQRVPGVTYPPETGTPGTPDADIDAPEAWAVTQGSPEVKIAILDTGIDQDHEDLAAKIVANMNFTDSLTFDDIAGHGTHVAGIAAAITNNNKGIAGIAIDSKLMNGKVLNDSGIGYNSWIANGIRWAADQGAKVINLSLGGSGYSYTVSSAVNYAWNKGTIVVAAAGNNGNSNPFYPAYYTNCIAVAATDQNDARASFSNYGSWVDIAAPGVNIISTYPDPTRTYVYAYAGGTSMASPHVAGVAALVWASEYGTSKESVRSRIESTADQISGTGTYWQHGRVNAYKAVEPTEPNAAPVATGEAYATNEDNTLSVAAPGVLSNDTDADPEDILAAMQVGSPSHGSLNLNLDGSFEYTPATNYNGADSFTYKAYDGKAYSNVATASITVSGINDPPDIISSTVTSATVGVQYTYDVDATDPDTGTPLTYSLTESPADMTINSSSGLIIWTPTSEGPQDVTVKVEDDAVPAGYDIQSYTIVVNPTPIEEELFADSFEIGEWNGLWIEDAQNDWFRSSQRATEGSLSAEVDGRATDATLTMAGAIDLSGRTSATLSFSWFIESSWDANEYIRLDVFYNGAWHNGVSSINGSRGTGTQENHWIAMSVPLDPGTFYSDFKIRFRARVSDSGEDGNVDNVKLIASS